jgi:lipopolysaccharide export system permease protein
MNLYRARTALRYIFFEMLPGFFMGVFVFVFILLLFQALRLTEFILIHGVKLDIIGRLMMYLSVSFLPVILPMSLLFSVLLTYTRLSQDSEIVAFKSIGFSMKELIMPAIVLGVIGCILSAETSFFLGPWGNRQFEVLIHDLGRQKMGSAIKEGVFSEGFFDLVVYANKVDSKIGKLQDVFIYDERDPKSPVTIIAREGNLEQDNSATGQSARLVLQNGNIHRTHDATYTKVDFGTYAINLFDPYEMSERKKSLPSLTLPEVKEKLNEPNLDPKEKIKLEIEYHRRWSLSVACFIFAILGVGLGTTTNRRLAKAPGFLMCLFVVVGYWMLYVAAENTANKGVLPVWVSLWLVNVLFLGIGIRTLRGTQT